MQKQQQQHLALDANQVWRYLRKVKVRALLLLLLVSYGAVEPRIRHMQFQKARLLVDSPFARWKV